MAAERDLTRLLRAGAAGQDDLIERIYAELHRIAEGHMRGEGVDHTLQATALVSEAWMRLGDERVEWRDRRHFYTAAAVAMRRVLIDHARRAKAQKRGGERQRVTLGTAEEPVDLDAERIGELHDALERLAATDERAAAVARLRFMTGLSTEETARALDASVRTVQREWAYARVRLRELLESE